MEWVWMPVSLLRLPEVMLRALPLESAIAAGMCTTNMGGSGNVAVLSSAHRMELLPFAQIVTRSCGALMLTVGGILVQMVG